MPLQMLFPLVIAEFGAPARLTVWQGPKAAQCLDPDPETLPHEDARKALRCAQLYVSSVLGWPELRTVHWAVTHAVDAAQPLPPLKGPSIFGAFTLSFLRLVTLEIESTVKPWAKALVPRIAGTPLEYVAISAAFNPCSGRFGCVGRIELKVAALSRLPRDLCRVLIVAEAQQIQLPVKAEDAYSTVYLLDGTPSLPVIRAVDPLDAIDKLFLLQSISALS